MREILDRLRRVPFIHVDVFDERVILYEPPSSWPQCDALISFYSKNFPLHKAIEYAKIFKPYLISDIENQYLLQVCLGCQVSSPLRRDFSITLHEKFSNIL